MKSGESVLEPAFGGGTERPYPGPAFARQWIVGTTLGLPVGLAAGVVVLGWLFAFLFASLRLGGDGEGAFFGGFLLASVLGMGLGVGTFQWLVLRRWIKRAGAWIPATAIGFLIGGPVWGFLTATREGIPLPFYRPLAAFAAAGLIIGLVQWLALVRAKVRGGFWWPVISGVAFGAGALIVTALRLNVGGVGIPEVARAIFLGPLIGLLTGVGMMGLLGHPMGRVIPIASLGLTLGLASISLSGKMTSVREEATTLAGHADEVLSVTWSRDGTRLASSGRDGAVWVWDPLSAVGKQVLKANLDGINYVAWSPAGNRLAGIGGKVLVWDTETWTVVTAFTEHRKYVSAVAWAPRENILAIGEPPGTILLIDASTGKQISRLPGHPEGISWLGWSPDGARLASIGICSWSSASSRCWDDVVVRIWDVGRGTVAPGPSHGRIATAAWSPDGRRLAIADLDGIVEVWDVTEAKATQVLNQAAERQVFPGPRVLAWSPDGIRLALVGSGIAIWNESTWALEAFLYERVPVKSIAWEPQGKRLAIGFEHITAISIWDAPQKREVRFLRGQTAGSGSVAWSPDGGWLASGGADKTVRVWRLGPAKR
ncbi:MAG TPA: hypothetical protein VJK02_03220 [Anaerolineales bacterium]|nr:hypothetical protein [Anaerolineales bacterium]